MGHGWLWPRHEQPLSQSGQNQTQAFKAPKPNGDISEKSHIVPPCFPTAKPTSTFVMFCYVLLQSDEHGVITIYYDEVDLQSGRDHKIS